MKKKILVLLYERMSDFEMTLACQNINNSSDFQILPIANSLDPITGRSGLIYIPKKKLADIKDLNDIEGIIIPGGEPLMLIPEFKELLIKLHHLKKMIAAICIAPEYLASLGILENVPFTSSMNPQYYRERGLFDPFEWKNDTHARVTVYDHIITAKGAAFIEFALEIWDYLGLYKDPQEKLEDKQMLSPQ